MTGTSFIPIVIVLIVVAKTRRIVNRFKNSGAINEGNAKTLEELKISRRFIFRKYLFRNIIIESNSKYYLNEQNLKDFRSKKRLILMSIVVILILVFIFMDIILT